MKPKLIIDPGHGGTDPGGGSNRYWTEKDLNLSISLYQFNRYLELGIPVALTRNTDITLAPYERAKVVRESGAEYCHSNHINAGGGDGAEVIHSIYSSRRMAEKVAKELKSSGQNVRRVFSKPLPKNARRDYYFMNRNTGRVNTIIVEYGFADSVQDDIAQLRGNWQLYAEAVVRAFCLFIQHPYEPPQTYRAIGQKQRYINLPASAESWRIYSPGAVPVKGNEKGFLTPSKFSGLAYAIQGTTQPHVYLIETRDFGRVQIYGHPDTGASITGR
ncbi:N-acetylmuramoyl-L-alanine amidase [Virgibacillus kekensis]|uniref:N-acetylmuramoyl-L-alanine amidase n=1 Tax=Virgibacillus kekensis TaxID=202261 RepID=A0ABV9DGE9_9BACI